MAKATGGNGLGEHLDRISKGLSTAKRVRAGFTEQAKYPDGTPVAYIAAIQNFGAPAKGIPPRPFFSVAIRAYKDAWAKYLGKQLQKANYNAYTALSLTGEFMAQSIARQLTSTDAPPLSPVTILLRDRFPSGGQTFEDVQQARRDVAAGVTGSASSAPLVWTGVMLGALQGPGAYEVEE